MRRERGFKVKTKLVKICRWVISRPGQSRRRRRIRSNGRSKRIKTRNPITKVINLARCLRKRLKPLINGDSGYVELRRHKEEAKIMGIPKGHLAVYVGESKDETRRYLVPVIYFNHPLFGELLKEAERVHGFNHPGRITIPCGPSEFEKVQMRIASSDRHQQDRRFIYSHYWL